LNTTSVEGIEAGRQASPLFDVERGFDAVAGGAGAGAGVGAGVGAVGVAAEVPAAVVVSFEELPPEQPLSPETTNKKVS
jgi:hypothetical protein